MMQLIKSPILASLSPAPFAKQRTAFRDARCNQQLIKLSGIAMSRRTSEQQHCCRAHSDDASKAQRVAGFSAILQFLAARPSLAEQHSGIFAVADIDAKTAGTIAAFLSPFLSISILLMICRIPLSWYPNLNVKKLPWVIAVVPTEPILGPTRRAIPPVGGVDIAPIIWVAVLTFLNEILLGPQGILNLLQRQAQL